MNVCQVLRHIWDGYGVEAGVICGRLEDSAALLPGNSTTGRNWELTPAKYLKEAIDVA